MVIKREKPTPVTPFDFFREHVEVINVDDRSTSEAVKPSKCPHCPHPLKGIHHYKTGKCKLCACEGPGGKVKGGYASALAASAPPTKKTRTKKPKEPESEPLSTDLGGDFGSALSRDFKRLTTKGKKR